MYTDRDDMEQRFGQTELIQLTDRARLDLIDDEILNRAIADAEAMVDSYLAPRYRLPLELNLVQGSNLPQATADIARYNLYGAQTTEEVEKRYERQVKWLRDVSNGHASLGAVDAGVATPEGRVRVQGGNSGHDWDRY
jgi:phage gp36-like protein